MKRIQTIVIIFLLLISCITVVGAEDIRSIDTILTEIKVEQGVSDIKQINPDRVSKEQLEELGDSVMEAMIGDPLAHERMDEMIGGEGSAALTAMHIRMGYNYLVNYPYGMMGPGSHMYYYNNGMMRYFGTGDFLAIGLILLVLVSVFAILIYRATRKNQKSSFETPLDILNKRFAHGEITKDEYEKMKDALNKL
jgi:putative membrane protein